MEQKNFEYNEMSHDGYKNKMGCCNTEYMEPNYMNCCNMGQNNMMMCPPIEECPQERVCHIIPCNTRIINHHVYRHTYTPCYTTCEENVVSNVYDRNCCF